jgi:hypothetical protein
MNDTELDEMLNQWKAPEPGAELRARIRGMQPRRRRFAWPSWHLGRGLLAGAAACGVALLVLVGIAAPETTAGSIPFTVDSQYTRYSRDGSARVTEYRTESMRDGAEVTLSSSYPDNALMTIHNRFFYAFQNLMYPMVRAVHGPNKRAITPETVANDCVSPGAKDVKVIRHEKILGYMTAVLRLPQGAGEDGRNTEWRAPALGCFVLRSTWEAAESDGSYRLTYEKRATKVTVHHAQ